MSVGLSIDQQMERWAQKRNLTAPTFSTGPAAGFTKPSAAAKQESRVQELMREGGSYGTDWPIASGIHVGAKTAVDRFFVSPLVRLFDSEAADEINRESDALIEAHRRLADKGDGYDWQKWVGKQSVGISSSLTGMLGLAAGGSAAGLAKTGSAILMGAGFGVSEANESYTAGLDAGLSEDKAKAYAAKMGALETGVMMIFHGLGRVVPGLGGTEDLFIREGVAKRLVPSLIKESAVRTIGELTEENITSILQSITTAMDIPAAKGTDSWHGEDGTVWNSPMMDVVRQTTVQTLMTLGVVEAATGRGRYKQMQMIRNADRLSPEDFVTLYPNEARQLAELDDSDLTRKKFVELSKLPTREGEGHEFQVKYKNDVKKAVVRRNAIENELQKPPDVTQAATDPEVGETGERVIPSEHATAAVGQMEEVQAPDVALRTEQFQEERVAGTEEAREELSQVSRESGAGLEDAQKAADAKDTEMLTVARRRARPTDLAVGDTVVRRDDGEKLEITGIGRRDRPVSGKRKGRKPVREEFYTYKDKKGVERTISEGAVDQYIKKAEAEAEAAPETETAPKATPVEEMSRLERAEEKARLKDESGITIPNWNRMNASEEVAALKKAQIKEEAKRLEIKGRTKMSDEELSDAVSAAQQDEQSRRDAVPKVLQDAEPGAVVVEVLPGRGLTGDTDERSAQGRSEKWVVKAGENLGIKVRIMDAEGEGALNTPAMLDTSTGDIWISRQYLNQREHAHRSRSRSRKSLERYMKRLVFHEWIHSLKRTHPDLYARMMEAVRNSPKFSQLHSQASAEYLENSRPLTQEEIDEGGVDTSNPAFWEHYNSLDAAQQQELLGEEGLATLAEDMSEKWGLFSALNSEDTGLFDRLRDWFRRTYQGVFKQNKLYKEIYSAMESASKEPATATTEDGGPVFAARRKADPIQLVTPPTALFMQMENEEFIFAGGHREGGNSAAGVQRLKFFVMDKPAAYAAQEQGDKEGVDASNLGFVVINLTPDKKVEGLINIEINEEKRRQGWGERIISSLVDSAEGEFLNVYDIQAEARGFWDRAGAVEYSREASGGRDAKIYKTQQPPRFAARREPDVALSARQVTEEVCGTCFSDVGSVFLIETRGREQYDPSIVGLIDKVGLENLVYVHGNAMVTDPATGETRLGGHAWIEAKGDQGWVVWDPEHKKVFDRDLYYKQAGAVPEIQYTDTDIALLTMKTQNHGPWYDEELFSGRGEPLGRPHPQSSAPPRFAARREPDAIPGSDKQGVTVLPEGQLLIHGTTRAAYEDIGESGTVVAGEKVSGGTIEEKGLIWLTDHRGTAEGFARGIEHHKDEPRPETGGVVTVRLPREMRIIDRNQELTEEQAKILNELNPRRSYDPIKEGTTINSAMFKLIQWEGEDAPKTFAEILPLIGFEGIRYDGGIGPNQFGVMAESLPVVDRQPVPPPPTFAARRRSSAARRRNVSQGIRTPPSPMPTRPERGLGPVEHDPLRASARQRLQTNFEEEEQAMLAWGENPHALDAEDTYVWRGILEARALESLDAGDEESLRRNQALQLAWDEAGTYWAMGGHARQNQFQETPEEEAFHELVNKLTGPSERSKARVKKIRGTQNKQAAAEAEAQGRLDTAQQEADEQAAIAEEAEQLAATTDDKALKRDATAEAKDARTQERGARGRAARATTDRDRARTQKNRSRERVHKALASDGKKALEAQKQLQAAGYDTSQEGLREIAADPVDHARAKVITGTAREISWVDRLLSIRRNAMLSGIKTQAVNMFGPLLYTGQQQLPLILEAGLHHATGGRVGQMGFPALTRLWSGFYAHLGAASTNALTSFRTGTQFFESEVMKKAGSSRAEAPNQAWGGLVGWGVETPQRLLGATDDFYKTVLTLSYLDAYGYQKFRNEGQTHEEAVGSMADVLEDPTNELWDEALVEAQRLTFTSRIDLAPLNLLRKMRQGDPNYLKGKWKDARIPFQIVSQTIVPFQDTPVNILAEGIKQTPAGLLMQIPGAINAAKDGDWSKVTSRSAQSLVGTMIGLALYNWVLGDDEEYPLITGTDIEHSPEKRELYNRRGMPQPQSFRIGDGWYSYERLDPLSTTLSLMVDAINASRRGDAGAEDLAAVAGQSLMRASLDKTFFSGISDIAEAIRRSLDVRPGEEEGSAVSRGIHHWGIGYATSWVPSLVKHYNQANQESYPERGLWGKEPEFGDRAMRRYAQRAEMGLAEDRPRIALFGEPIPRHTPFSNPAVDWAWRFASPIRAKAHDPFVGNRIIMNWNRQNPKAQLNPRSPRYIRIKDTTIYLTDEQLEDYARLGGGNARKIIEYVESQGGFDDPANPTLKDKEIVKRAVERGYRQARMALVPQWNQDHAITDKILDRRVETGKMTPAQVQEYKSTRQTRQYVSP